MGLLDSIFGRKKKPVEAVQVQREPEVKQEEREVKLTKKEKQELAMSQFHATQQEKDTAVVLTKVVMTNEQIVQEVRELQKELRASVDKNKDAHVYTQQLVSDTKNSVDSIKLDYAKGRQVDDIKREIAEILNAVKKYIPDREIALKAKIDTTQEDLDRLVQLDPLEKIILDLLSSNSSKSFDTDELMAVCHLDKALSSNRVKFSRIMSELVEDGAVLRDEKNKRNILFRISPMHKKK